MLVHSLQVDSVFGSGLVVDSEHLRWLEEVAAVAAGLAAVVVAAAELEWLAFEPVVYFVSVVGSLGLADHGYCLLLVRPLAVVAWRAAEPASIAGAMSLVPLTIENGQCDFT